jgi:hypothetical protein
MRSLGRTVPLLVRPVNSAFIRSGAMELDGKHNRLRIVC